MAGGPALEIATLRGLFTSSRLTTVTGPPGAGKTSVATEAAFRSAGVFPGGARVVPLSELPDEALLAHAVMRTVGVPDQPGLPQAEALCHGLRESRSLLVLDGCEHLVRDCASLVRRLLRHCPGLHVAVTSAEPLGLDGERVFSLSRDPEPADGLAQGRLHQLCEPAERLLWARLSVFGTEFSLPDAVGVCADASLRAAAIPGAVRGLARRSLLIPSPGTGQYRMPEAVREYGAMMLRELGEDADARGRYRAWREVRD
ncbi:MAG: hypothetical protein FWE35_15755 [Streptosporangiales bacterium]|nr:hypothetical protein [Streptosporangiales bacterium]